MNILLINHYAGSPTMGMEYRPYYMAREWTVMGHNVTVILANNSHLRKHNPELSDNFFEQNIDGINYLWVKTPEYEGNGFGRVKNMFAFVRKIFNGSSFIANKYKPDVVIASSTYPSDNYVARKIAKLSGAKYIYEVHDLWPLSPMELGGMSKYHPFILAMQHAETFAYRNADAVVSMLPKTKDYMVNKGLSPEKWFFIPNGFVKPEWDNPAPLNKETAKRIEEIRSKFNTLVGYAGTLGLANALHSLLMAGEKTENSSVAIVIAGKGPEKENLLSLISEKDINNVFILDPVDKKEIPGLLSEFDILYIGLQYQPLFRFGISPNKMIDYMMAGKPVIQAIKAGNNMVEEAGCGIAIEPENPEKLAEAILKLKDLPPSELERMGNNGRKFAVANHDYKVLSKQFEELMLKLQKK